jgi:hypothetical protein
VAAKRLSTGKIDPWIYFSPDSATNVSQGPHRLRVCNADER